MQSKSSQQHISSILLEKKYSFSDTKSNNNTFLLTVPFNMSKKKRLKVLKIRKICDDYKFYYFLRQSHPDIKAKTCSKKKYSFMIR